MTVDEEIHRYERSLAVLRESSADFLTHLATSLGDARFRSAAAILRGSCPGRRAIDDAKPLAYARSLLRAGVANSPHRACELAAEMFAMPHQVETMRDRLRKKFRTQPVKSEDDKKSTE